jgi:hypothetical protein
MPPFYQDDIKMGLRTILIVAACSWSLPFVSSFMLPVAPSTAIRPARSYYLNSAACSESEVNNTIGTVTILVPSLPDQSLFGSKSPVPPPTYQFAAEQLARKIGQFSDGRITASVVNPLEKDDDENDECLQSNALIALGLRSPKDIQYLSRTFRKRRTQKQEKQLSNTCQFAVDCGSNNYAPIVGTYDEANPSILADLAPWTDIASGKRLTTQMAELFEKNTSDEFALAIMLFFNQFSGSKIPWVQHSIDVTWEKGLVQNSKEIYAMITKCGHCIANCLNDENCASCIKGRLLSTLLSTRFVAVLSNSFIL